MHEFRLAKEGQLSACHLLTGLLPASRGGGMCNESPWGFQQSRTVCISQEKEVL